MRVCACVRVCDRNCICVLWVCVFVRVRAESVCARVIAREHVRVRARECVCS